ncbi:MAG: hypothetical protein IPM39_04990 [Chloroflexi bacterium]|nr:hypothetical protein [Chloroflexota bacterium]
MTRSQSANEHLPVWRKMGSLEAYWYVIGFLLALLAVVYGYHLATAVTPTAQPSHWAAGSMCIGTAFALSGALP